MPTGLGEPLAEPASKPDFEANPLFGGLRKAMGLGRAPRVSAARDPAGQQFLAALPPDGASGAAQLRCVAGSECCTLRRQR